MNCFDLYHQRLLEITVSNIRLQMDGFKLWNAKDRKISVKSNLLCQNYRTKSIICSKLLRNSH